MNRILCGNVGSRPSPNTNQTGRVKGTEWKKLRPGICARPAPIPPTPDSVDRSKSPSYETETFSHFRALNFTTSNAYFQVYFTAVVSRLQ